MAIKTIEWTSSGIDRKVVNIIHHSIRDYYCMMGNSTGVVNKLLLFPVLLRLSSIHIPHCINVVNTY